jgi:hypothetical protein
VGRVQGREPAQLRTPASSQVMTLRVGAKPISRSSMPAAAITSASPSLATQKPFAPA